MCMVAEGDAGKPWGEETLIPGSTHQHRVHSWEIFAPAHLLTRELLPHESRQSQNLCEKYSPELSRFSGSSLQGPGLI
jgi:hypothetical protein